MLRPRGHSYKQWDKLGWEVGEGAGSQVTREIAEGLGVLCPESTQYGDVMSSPDTWRRILQGESEELSKLRGAVSGVSGLFLRKIRKRPDENTYALCSGWLLFPLNPDKLHKTRGVDLTIPRCF